MLHIFADALLIAARFDPPRPASPRRMPVPETEHADRRRWFTLIGVQL